MSIELKESVSLSGVRPEMVMGLVMAEGVYSFYGVPLVVTSVTDGEHGPHSRHRVGLGADLRTFNIPDGLVMNIVEDLMKVLGPGFDIVLESDHIHLEYDPEK